MTVRESTINAQEVEHYEALADTWWDRAGPFWPLHRLNELRVDAILAALTDCFGLDADSDRPLAGLRVLDVGCGGGILSESMARLGADVTGIDVVEKNIAIADLHARQQNLDIRYLYRSPEIMAATGATFDVVLNMEVVEHVADLPAFMRACNRMTRPGGVMIVATINRTLLAWLFAIVGAEYVLRWLPRGTHRWRDFRKPQEIERLWRTDGLTTLAATGVAVNPITRSFKLTQNRKVNYMLVGRRRER